MEKLGRKMNIVYSGLQGAYWMAYCMVLSFAAVFLQARGYSGTEIGVIMAAANALSLIMQPVIADLADRSKKISVLHILWVMCALTLVYLVIVSLVSVRCALLTVTYALAFAFIIALQPFLTTLTFYAEARGVHISFSVSRAIGSFSYAVLAAVMGSVVAKLGEQAVPVTAIIIILIFMAVLLIFTLRCRSIGADAEPEVSAQEKSSGIIEFLKGNRRFSFFLLGVALMFAIHSLQNNFTILIVQNVGGDSADMGRICGYMAFLEVPVMLLFDRLGRRWSCSAILKFSVVMFTVKAFAIFLAPSIPLMYAAFFFQAPSFALYTPAAIKYAVLVVDQKDAVKAQAFLTLTCNMGSIFSSLLGGYMFDTIGTSMTLLAGAIVTAVGTVIAFPAIMSTGRNHRI